MGYALGSRNGKGHENLNRNHVAFLIPPYGQAARDAIVELVNRITAIEAARGVIARTARSALAPAAQPYQDLVDRILYTLAGLSESEWLGLEDRLVRML